MFASPQKEHGWLDRLLGEWTAVSECRMPDGSTHKGEGRVTCRSLGGYGCLLTVGATTPLRGRGRRK